MMLPIFTTSEIIRQLRTQWPSGDGPTRAFVAQPTINYSIDNTTSSGFGEHNYAYNMTVRMEAMAGTAFELWDDLISISLNPVTSGGDVCFDYSTRTNNGGTYSTSTGLTTSGTNIYGTTQLDIARSYVWCNSGWASLDSDSDIVYGASGFKTYLHEIGHSLGISHPGSYNAGNGNPTYATSAEFAQDTRAYTVMSYFDANEDGSGTDHFGSTNRWMYGSTPLLYDIAAIQAIYGADMTTRTGATTYGFNANAGNAVYDFNQNRDAIFSIWDAGGVDTIDASGYSTNQTINLNAGAFSNIGYMTRNISVAFNVTIENAIGGSGADTLYGNTAVNSLDGRAGSDTAILTGVQSNYTFSGVTTNFRATGFGVTDNLLNVEYVRFTGGGNAVAVSSLLQTQTRDDYRDTLGDITAPFGVLSVNAARTGAVETNGDRDIFSVSLVSGQTYTFELSKTSLADPLLRLLSSTGSQLAINDDVTSTSVNSKIVFRAASTGTYYLEARDFSTGTGSYTIRATGQIALTDDYRDSITDITAPVGTLGIGTSKTGAIETAGDKDILAVSLLAGSTYTFFLSGQTLDDPYLRLRNSSNSIVAFNDDDGSSVNSRVVFTAATSGTYFLEAAAYDTSDIGSYTIRASAGSVAQSSADGEEILFFPNSGSDGSAQYGFEIF